MNKTLFYLLIAGLLVTMPVLAACGGEKETTTPPPTTTPATTTPPTTTTPTTTPPTTTPPTTTPPTTTTEPDVRGELSTTYKYTIVFSSSDGSSGTYKVWVKGEKLRVEMTMRDPSGEETTMIIIISEGYDYWYMPEENMAYKFPSGSAMSPAVAFRAFAAFFTGYYTVYFSDAMILAEMETICAADPNCLSVKIVGHETIRGEECTVFEILYTGDMKSKIWLATNKGYVLKVESITPEETVTIEFKDMDLSPTIPDSMFELPEGVEIQELPGM